MPESALRERLAEAGKRPFWSALGQSVGPQPAHRCRGLPGALAPPLAGPNHLAKNAVGCLTVWPTIPYAGEACEEEEEEVRISYDIVELIDCDRSERPAGFTATRWQPYRNCSGRRLSAPTVEGAESDGFTEIVCASEGLHAIITDWQGSASTLAAVWAESVGERYGYLYIGLEGDGRLEVEGLGQARRRGVSCSLTVAPPGSTYIWRTEPGIVRRGVCIAFHAGYVERRYPELLASCGGTLGPWLANRETRLRDFDVPLLPVMSVATAGLLNMNVEGEFRHHFVSATIEQSLCLAISALAARDGPARPARLSVRDRSAIEQIRVVLDGNLASPPAIEELTRRFGINRNKLRFGFKEIFGLPVSDYLNEQRMRTAYDMLSSGRHSVSDVAASVGYTHLCNFTTAFKRRYGRPPSQCEVMAQERSVS